MTPSEKQEFEELKATVNALKASTTIPFDVEQAFRTRLKIADFSALTGSTKAASTETQAVNEGGAGTYNVAKPMDGFREFVVGGSVLYIPYYL